MKTKNKIRAAGLLLLSLIFQFSFATSTGGSIMGQVTDPETKEPVSDATVIFENQGTQKIFYTNEHGYYYASNIPAGVYNVTAAYMSKHVTIGSFKINNDESRTLDIALGAVVSMDSIILVFDSDPVDPIEPIKDIFIHKVINHLPVQKVSDLADLFSGVIKVAGEYYVRGARAGGLSYYIDGCRVMGSPDIPLCGLDTYRMYNGFIPPKYGDATGGVVVMETRNFFGEQ